MQVNEVKRPRARKGARGGPGIEKKTPVHPRSHLARLRTFLGAHRFRGANRVNQALGGRGLPRGPVACRVLGNRWLIVDPSQDAYQRHLFLSGEYEPGTLNLMREVLRPGDVFVDAGANLGLMTIHASALVGSEGAVVAFEPSPQICQSLRQNVALNACTNVEVHEVALGERSGNAIFYARPGINIASGTLVASPDSLAQTQVPVRALTDSLDPRHRNRLRLIKIDVEGYELPVLRGSLALLTGSPRPILCVEFGEDSQGSGQQAAHMGFMEAIGGYEPFVFAGSKFSKCALIPWSEGVRLRQFDNIVYIPRVAVPTLPGTLFVPWRQSGLA
jgi:FkbM family methyltransferase